MPLLIPDILQNAAAVIDAADSLVNQGTNSSVEFNWDANLYTLSESIKKVNSDDLMAVLNEVGRVYSGVYNMQIISLGSGVDFKERTLNIALQVEFGMGPRPLVLKLPFEQAKQVVEQLQKDLATLKPPAVITSFGA